MKILVLLTDLFDAIGGIQTFNRSFVKAMDEIAATYDLQITVLVLNDTGANPAAVEYFDGSRTKYSGFERSKSHFLHAVLSEAAKTSTIMLGHINFTPLLIGLRWWNPDLHSFLIVYGIDAWSRLPALQRMGLKKVDRILSISESTKEKMAATNNLNGTRVEILPCTLEPYYGVDVQLRSRDELGLPHGKMILSTSRLSASEQYKRIEDVIAALPAVLDRVPEAFYVVVGDGTDRKRLEQFANDTGVAENVRFVGRVQDDFLASYYYTSDLFVLPSLREGFGIVFLEAMYYGKPCIGVHAGATPEVIKHGVTGILSEPKNVEELGAAIIRLLLDDALRVAMGNAGRQRLEQQFSFAMFRDRLGSLVSQECEVLALSNP